MLANYDARAVAEVMGLDLPRIGMFAAKHRPTDPQAGAATFSLIEQAVENGLPRTALRHVAEWVAGGDKSKIASFEWGVVPKTTLERRESALSRQESERTERVARLAVHACRALGSQAEARDFMTAPHPELDGRTPLEAAKSDRHPPGRANPGCARGRPGPLSGSQLRLWRMVTGPHPIWSGEGARLFGQRWDPPGLSAIYTGTSFAVCLVRA